MHSPEHLHSHIVGRALRHSRTNANELSERVRIVPDFFRQCYYPGRDISIRAQPGEQSTDFRLANSVIYQTKERKNEKDISEIVLAIFFNDNGVYTDLAFPEQKVKAAYYVDFRE